MSKTILSVREVVKQYSTHTALNKVSIDVPEQSVFGLLGPNGAGKTSLIRIINQITAPDSGEIYLNAEKLCQNHVQIIGYLPEERGLYKKMKVGEQALYLAQLKGLSKQDALKKLKYWFEKLEIQSWWDKKVEELSKGMQQKIQFVTTVLHEPKLLILDEPFSGFDPINANILKQEILALRDNGATVIFSTHNMASVEEICDHIALINQAEKILDGSVRDVRNTYKSNCFEICFKGNLISFTNNLWTHGSILSHRTEHDINTVNVKLSQGNSVNQVLSAILPVADMISMRELIPSMNEIFISAVERNNQKQPLN